ncbi:MAG: acyl-CoA dehydrogenase family protein [Deltaproteobacteria bacterium]|nr:acyl-CoA dehydrogenase family protein [Deltaproteobacteria bacterium]
MNYTVTEEQKSLQERIARFCTEEIAPISLILDNTASHGEGARLVKDNIKKMARIGYLGLCHGTVYGGAGISMVSQTIAGEELAKACPATFYAADVSSRLFGTALELFGTKEQKERYLPGVIDGDIIGSFGMSDVNRDGNIFAEKRDNRWVINGNSTVVANGSIAGLFIFIAQTGKGIGDDRSMTAFLIDAAGSGISIGEPYNNAGFRGLPIADITLKDCEASEEYVLGGIDEGTHVLIAIQKIQNLGMAVCSLGISMACMQEAKQYFADMSDAEKTVRLSQSVSFKLADMMIMTDISRLLIHKAAWAMDVNDGEAAVLASCANVFAGESAGAISGWLMNVEGSDGYKRGTMAEKLYRDAKFCEIGGGTAEYLRDFIGTDMLDRFKN